MAFGSNRAPRLITIGATLVLVALGALGTLGDSFPETGVWLLVIATALMLLGIFFRRI